MRAADPDEAIASGESGMDEDYERILVMKFDKETKITSLTTDC